MFLKVKDLQSFKDQSTDKDSCLVSELNWFWTAWN